MLKMTIDNEEVLSNNDISIKEEILSPSSTILNNVYPKTWEQDKDYVSRFYYPKDYSKLNIQNFSVEPEEAGTTIQVNGSATLNDVDTTKESRVLRLLGQTSQVQYTGKNTFDLQDGTYSNNGMTAVVSNGEISLTGTTSVNAFITIPLGTEIEWTIGQTYSIGAFNPTGNANVRLRVNMGGGKDTNCQNINATNTIAYTTTIDDIYTDRIQIRVQAGTTITTPFIMKPMRIVGTTLGDYEPYVGGIPSPNPQFPQPVNVVSGDNEINICGKNLFDIDNAFHISISGSGAVGTNEDYRTTDYISTQPNTSYYFSTTQISGQTAKQIYIAYYDSNKTFISRTSYNLLESAFTTPTNTHFIRAGVYSKGQENVMLEKGSTKTTYEPYIGNSYPIYLGVENLIEDNKIYLNSGLSDSGVIFSNAPTRTTVYKVPVLPNSTYTVSCANGYQIGNIFNYNSSETWTNTTTFAYSTSHTFTNSSTTYFISFVIRRDDNGNMTSSDLPLLKIQLTKGSHIQYITDNPIELCKIGTYQDYIYKTDKWYLHKEIGKWYGKDFDWTDIRVQQGVLHRSTGVYNLLINSNGFCNFYNCLTQSTRTNPCFYINESNRYIDVIDSSIPNGTFKTYCETNNIMFYAPLYEPTNTEITDTTLLEQLDALESQ